MNSSVLVSVVLPAFNAERFLVQAARSILAQSMGDLELIIVDDGSTDGSWQIAKALADADGRVRSVRMAENAGYPTAMNRGIEGARGRFLARMDADDISLPRRLERQVQVYRHDEHSLCGTDRLQLSPRGYPIPKPVSPDELGEETWDDLMDDRRLFTDPSVLVDLERVREVGGYRTYTKAGQDVDLWLRLMERFGPAIVIHEPLYGRRLLPGAITYSPNLRGQKELVRMMARQRRERGFDAVESGERPQPQSSLRDPAGLRRDADWVTGARWLAAERSAWAGDLPGALEFVTTAVRAQEPGTRVSPRLARRVARVAGMGVRGFIDRGATRAIPLGEDDT